MQQAALTASDGTNDSFFGYSVAISGGTVVVGANSADTDLGTAYVFTESGAGWGTMTQTAKLTSSDSAAGDNFGEAVAISGNTVVVGASGLTVNGVSGQGAAYVFTEPASGWTNMTQTAKLIEPSNEGGGFGTSVAISGNTVVVGAPYGNVAGATGAAYVFNKPASGWADMTGTTMLTPSDGSWNDGCGDSVSINGNAVVVGAPRHAAGAGAAYLFVEPSSGWASMTQTAELTASDGVAQDAFGTSVSISGNTVVAGASYAQPTGAAYVFTEPGAGWGNMTQTAKLTSSNATGGQHFGSSVSVSGNAIVVGDPYAIKGPIAPGAAYSFTKPASGWTNMTETDLIVNPAGQEGDNFGNSLSLSGSTLVVGAWKAMLGDIFQEGAAYVFANPALAAPTDSPGVYSGGYWYFNVNGTTQVVASPAGWAGATPVVGDWNGAGKDEIGLFLNGNWWLDTNGDGTLDSGDAQFTFGFGGSGVVPVVGDWNGGGKTEVGVYANGAWFRDVDGTHTWDATNQAALAYLGWNDNGTNTVIPVPGQWAGDGKTEMGVYCQGVWFLDSTDSNKWDGGHTYWGWSGSLIPVVGNWTGSSAKSQFGVYNQGAWFLDYDNSHTWDAANQAALTFYGWTGAMPLVGNWGSGFKAAERQAASSLQVPLPAAGQLQPAANEAIAGGTVVGASASASGATSSPLLLTTEAPDGESDPQSGTAVQPERRPGRFRPAWRFDARQRRAVGPNAADDAAPGARSPGGGPRMGQNVVAAPVRTGNSITVVL